jgi:uncharacterized membrane protein YccC
MLPAIIFMDVIFTLAVGYCGAMFAIRRVTKRRLSTMGTDDYTNYRRAMNLLTRQSIRNEMVDFLNDYELTEVQGILRTFERDSRREISA